MVSNADFLCPAIPTPSRRNRSCAPPGRYWTVVVLVCNCTTKAGQPVMAAPRACLQRDQPFPLANCDRTLAPLRVSPGWGDGRCEKGVPLIGASSSLDAIGAGMGTLAGEGRLPFL